MTRIHKGIVGMLSLLAWSPLLAHAEDVVETEPVEETATCPTSGSVEVFTGYAGAEVDAKTTTDLGAGFGLFTRNFGSFNYFVGQEGFSAGNFGIVDLTYTLGPHGDFVLEGQYSLGEGSFFVPRVGLQAYGGAGPLSLYGLATVGPSADATVELLGTMDLDVPLKGDVSLHVGIEALVDFGLEGPSFATEKARVGLAAEHFEAGGAVNLVEVPGEAPIVNAGPYVKAKW